MAFIYILYNNAPCVWIVSGTNYTYCHDIIPCVRVVSGMNHTCHSIIPCVRVVSGMNHTYFYDIIFTLLRLSLDEPFSDQLVHTLINVK